MQSFWVVSLAAVWAVTVLNLALILRVVHWVRSTTGSTGAHGWDEEAPLAIGSAAPDFRAETLFGEAVTLADFAAQSVAFLFVSPRCGVCALKVPGLVKAARPAHDRAAIKFVLVIDASRAEARTWIDSITSESGIEVNLPILLAPLGGSRFILTYDPQGILPYFSVVRADGTIAARGVIGHEEWEHLESSWGGEPLPAAARRAYF